MGNCRARKKVRSHEAENDVAFLRGNRRACAAVASVVGSRPTHYDRRRVALVGFNLKTVDSVGISVCTVKLLLWAY